MNETLLALLRIQQDAAAAIEALADEREGDFTKAVRQLHAQSTYLHELVQTW